MVLDAVQFLLQYFITILVVISPFAIIALFVSMTASYTVKERIKTAKTSCLVAFSLLAFFALAGEKIFEFFGISMGSFYIAGGVLVFLVGLDMLRSQDDEPKPESAGLEVDDSKKRGRAKEDISITPLGVPIIAGPCCITNVIAQQAKASNCLEFAGGFVALALVILVLYGCLTACARGAKWLTPTVLRLSYRLSGLILAALAVELLVTGLKSDDIGLFSRESQQMVIKAVRPHE